MAAAIRIGFVRTRAVNIDLFLISGKKEKKIEKNKIDYTR